MKRIDLVALSVLGAAAAAMAMPWALAAQDADGGEKAIGALKQLTAAESDFRANDRDGNLVTDFWTGDIYALYAMVPVPGGDTKLPPDKDDGKTSIKLIEPGVAAADGASATGQYAKVKVKNAFEKGEGASYSGYFFRMFAKHDDGDGKPTSLKQDTDGKEHFYGQVHDRSRFAIAAAPEKLEVGKHLYIINADNTIWSLELPKTYTATFVPLAAHADSSSAFKCGVDSIDDAGTFPAAPGRHGFKKGD